MVLCSSLLTHPLTPLMVRDEGVKTSCRFGEIGVNDIDDPEVRVGTNFTKPR